MKKLITLCCIVIAFGTTSFAQFKKGTMLVGGSVSAAFNTNKTRNGGTTVTNSKTSYIDFTPYWGIFVVDKFAIGAGLDSRIETNKSPDGDDKHTYTQGAFQPFARYYFSNFYAFGTLSVGSGNDKHINGNVTENDRFSLFGGSLGVGYALMLNEHVAVEPQIGYASNSTKYDNSDSRNISGGVFLKVAFQIYLPRK